MGGAMDAGIDAFAPGVSLTIEVVDIGEADACPEALLDDPDRALDVGVQIPTMRRDERWVLPQHPTGSAPAQEGNPARSNCRQSGDRYQR